LQVVNLRDVGGHMDQLDTLQELLPRVKKFGERPAVIAFAKDRTETWTYAKLADQAARLASGLAKEGIEKGQSIALWAEPGPSWMATCLGVLYCGAVAVPLDVQLSDDSLKHALKDSEARFVFTTSRLLKRLKGLPKRLHCEPILFGEDGDGEDGARGWQDISAEPAEPAASVSPEDRAVVFYTSGTTGPPKGVPLTHRNLAFQLNTLLTADLVTSEDRVLLPLPLHHVYPFTIGTLTPWALGLPIVLPYMLTGPQLMRALNDGGVTLIIGVPRLYRALMSGIESRVKASGRLANAFFRLALALSTALVHGRIRVGSLLFRQLHREMGPQLRVLATGGAAMDPDLAWKLEGLGWLIGTGYGLTETSPLLTIDKPGQARIGSVGQTIPGVELRIDPVTFGDDDDQGRAADQPEDVTPRGPGQEGEIVARGPSVFSGYLNLPKETKKAFTDDGWFRTGDLGHFDKAGSLYVTGRVKTLIVLEGGEKAQPDDVEEAYQRGSAAIGEIGALAPEGKLVAVIHPNRGLLGHGQDGEKAADEAVRKALEEQSRRMPSYQRITDFVMTNSPLPRTRLGKIRREELRQLYEQLKKGGQKRQKAGPISEEEMSPDDRALLDDPGAARTWQWLTERFHDRPLTPDTSPQLDLGIDSLEWLNLTLELRQCCGIELSGEAIGRIETVRDLLREVAEQPPAEGAGPVADPLEEPDKVLGDERQHWLAPLGKVEAAVARFLYHLNWTLFHSAFRLCVDGKEHLPAKGPFVLTPSHVSYLDSPVLAASLDYRLLEDTYWAGWSGIANGPFFRVLRRICHVVPIDPDRAVASSLAFGAVVLREKHNLVWFPEGGLSKTGELMPLRPGIGMLLEHYRMPVVPVSVQGTRDALPPGHGVPRPGGVIHVTFGEPLDPHDLEKKGKGKKPSERITSALHDEMARLQRKSDRPSRARRGKVTQPCG
jgi:long-chain acyl-CoA synthetase